jgi:hypothetical protein
MIYIVIISILILLGLLILAINEGLEYSKKEWHDLNEFKKRLNSVQTKDEISILYQDMLKFANSSKNEYIHIELKIIDAYLRGLYKNAK